MKKTTLTLLATAALAAAAAPALAGKIDDWKKVRPDIEIALRCEAGFIASSLHEIETVPELQNDMSTQNNVKPRLEARAEQLKSLGLAPIRSDQECNDKLLASLRRAMHDQPHATIDDVEKAANSSAVNYLLGRWGVAQARLGKGHRVRTGQAFLIKDRLQYKRDDQRRPVNEYGKDAEVRKAAEGDALLAYFITLGSDGDRDYIGDAMNDIFNNLDANTSFSYDETSYDKVKAALSLTSGYERSLVGQVSPTTLTAMAKTEKEDGEEVVKMTGGTYALVFFRPMEFTASECTSWVQTGSWTFSDNGMSPVEKCKALTSVKARFTLFPVAVEPEVARQLKPGSNLDCLLSSTPIPIDVPAKKKIAAWNGQSVTANALSGSSLGWTSVGEQYNQMAEGALDTCIPILIADGTGKDRVPRSFMGIMLD